LQKRALPSGCCRTFSTVSKLWPGDFVQAALSAGSVSQYNAAMASTQGFPLKLQFSGHETFPLRQLWLRKAFNAVVEVSGDVIASKKVFAEDAAIGRFGVGKNMVAAIRHWALACDVIREGNAGSVEIGPIGRLLFGKRGADPYLERPATCWLVHWLLAGRALRSTTWYWMFNRLTQQTFDRTSVILGLESLAQERQARVSPTTLKRDIEVCLRCYLPRADGRESDDAYEPLLVDIGLISEGPTGTFQFRRGQQQTLPDALFTFALLEFWKRWEAQTGSSQMTLSFEAIAHDYGSPGRVFKLDENSVAERLMNLETISKGALRWTDSAGVRQVSRHENSFDDAYQDELLRRSYEH
jgi:hypothetical protein